MEYTKERFIKTASVACEHMNKIAEGGFWQNVGNTLTSDPIASGAATGVISGVSAYALAKMLKLKRAWMYGLGAGALGAAGGAFYGDKIMDFGRNKLDIARKWIDRKRITSDKHEKKLNDMVAAEEDAIAQGPHDGTDQKMRSGQGIVAEDQQRL